MAANEAKMDYGVEDLKQNMIRYSLFRLTWTWGITLTGTLASSIIAKVLI